MEVWKVNEGQTEWYNSGQSVLTLYTRKKKEKTKIRPRERRIKGRIKL